MWRRGFTIVELAITVTIIGILLTLAVVNMNQAQMNARDSERKGDVEAIAMAFEAYYSNNVDGAASGNTYPGTNNINESWLTTTLPKITDVNQDIFRSPTTASTSPISLVPATNNNQFTWGIDPNPYIDDTYVYQPLDSAGNLCVDPALIAPDACRKFNIYYNQEGSASVQMVTSKNQ